MTRRALPLAATAAVLLAGCGGNSERDRVRAYLEDLDAVHQQTDDQLQDANAAYRDYASGKLKGKKAEDQLRQAELAIAGVRQQIAAVPAPARAHRLKTLLLRSYDLDVLMATETRELATFVPRAQRVVGRLPRARAELRQDLKAAHGLDRQSRALKTYATRVGRLHDQLIVLRAPPALQAVKETQLRVLAHTRTLSNRLVRAIAAQDKPAINRLLEEFAAGGDPQPERVAWERGSLKAYQERIRDLDRAAAEVRQERAKLADELG